MAKKKLSQVRRDLILEHQLAVLVKKSSLPAAINTLRDEIIVSVNTLLRKMFPESDMKVLKKYNLLHHDKCYRFVNESGLIYGFSVDHRELDGDNIFIQIPRRYGCVSGEVFQGNDKLEKDIADYKKLRDDFKEYTSNKRTRLYSFLQACIYIEDVEAVIPLPDELRIKLYGENRALTTINPDLIAELKEDYATP